MDHLSPSQLAEFFNTLCDAAARETLPRFRQATPVTNKLRDAFDPVTEGDRQAERAIRDLIEERLPDHGIVGEEFGTTNPGSAYQWIIDPIDGTRAFISGLPVWGTLIGLYHEGQPLAGVMDQPFTGERYMALPQADGEPAQSLLSLAGKKAAKVTTSPVSELAQATLMTTSPYLFTSEREQAYFAVEKAVKMARYGCDCYAYCMVASGQIEMVIESGLNIYDIAALIPIIEYAGGVVTDWEGNAAHGGGFVLATANKALHEQALNLLNA